MGDQWRGRKQRRVQEQGLEEKERCLLGEEKGKSDGRPARLVTFLSLLTQPFLVTRERASMRGGEPVVTKQCSATGC